MECRASALLLLLALLVAVCSAGTGASRISIVNDAADEGVAIRPAFDYPWAGFRSLFSVSGFQQAANDLRSIVENAISHIRIDKIVRSSSDDCATTICDRCGLTVTRSFLFFMAGSRAALARLSR